MVKLELELTEIDYDYLIKEFLPKIADKLQESGNPLAGLLSGGMAGTLIQMAPTSMKDKVVAEFITSAAPRLSAQIEKVAADNGVSCKVKNLRAIAQSDGE